MVVDTAEKTSPRFHVESRWRTRRWRKKDKGGGGGGHGCGAVHGVSAVCSLQGSLPGLWCPHW